MIEGYLQLIFLVLTASSLVSSNCPQDRIHSTGHCEFRVDCIGNITGIGLPDGCKGSVNHIVSVKLTLYNADDSFDNQTDHLDVGFVTAVTAFKATGSWPETNLTFLNLMPKLQRLELTNIQMEFIDGNPLFYLNYLEHVDFSNNYLTDINNLFFFDNHQNKLKLLFLSNNRIEILSGDVFSELTSLIELDLSHNRISDLNAEPFNNLTSLEVLRLNGNVIKDLNGAIKELVSLKHLYLKDNLIQNFHKHYLKINHLETFDVSGNQLEKFTPNMFLRHWDYIGGVCKIILSDNELTSILDTPVPKLISSRSTRGTESKVNFVTEVDLSKNHINKVEYDAFQSIIRMTSLDLSSNNITIFIVNPRDLKDVKFLNLSCNFIAHLYHASFSSMTNLQNLDLSHNMVKLISRESFTDNYNLKHVNLSYNDIHMVKSVQVNMFHTEGGVLDLSYNGLSSFSIPSGEALHLTVLVLNSNNILDTATINVYYQNELKHLEMQNNLIEKLNETSLMLPLSLNSLDLSVNRIKEIGPSSFHRVAHLKSLFLGHNKLSKIQYGAFQGLTTLVSLDLSNNYINHLDSKVLSDLRSLSVLSLRSNHLNFLDYRAWLNHAYILRVYVDDNEYSCEWLSRALFDFNNGISRMRPTVRQFQKVSSRNSVEGIPCVSNETEMLTGTSSDVLVDDRLLVTNQKILEAVRDQTHFLRNLINELNLLRKKSLK